MKRWVLGAGTVAILAAVTVAFAQQVNDDFRAPRTPVPPVALQSAANPNFKAGGNDVQFYSEQVLLKGKVFVSGSYNPQASAPAVVLAADLRQTAASLEPYAEALANKGVVALVFDYRGWGRSGGFPYVPPEVRTDDRLRFSYHTPTLTIRRGRVDLDAQVQDIRNAMTYLQSLPGIDQTRIGLLGAGQGGGNVIQAAGMDTRVRGIAAISPVIAGKDAEMLSFAPSPAIQADLVKLARMPPPKTRAEADAMNAMEARVSLAEFRPFMVLGQISDTTPVLFVAPRANADITAAAAKLRGPKDVKILAPTEAAEAAADFLSTRMTPAPVAAPGGPAPGGGRNR
jgi:dienelactone hydrolase